MMSAKIGPEVQSQRESKEPPKGAYTVAAYCAARSHDTVHVAEGNDITRKSQLTLLFVSKQD
jgi:hypothetical protein